MRPKAYFGGLPQGGRQGGLMAQIPNEERKTLILTGPAAALATPR